QEFPFLEPSARQPLDLEEELRAQPAEQLLSLGFVAFQEKRGNHAFAPGVLPWIVLAKDRVNRRFKTGFKTGEFGQQLLLGHLLEVLAAKISRTEAAWCRPKKIQFWPAEAVGSITMASDFLEVPGQPGRIELAQLGKLAASQPAGAR